MCMSKKTDTKRFESKNCGYATLFAVLLVGAVGVAITLSLVVLGLGSSRTSFVMQQSYQAKAFAFACAEEGLQQIRSSTPFTGSGTLLFSEGSCGYTVTNTGGQNRRVVATGTVSMVVRKVDITVTAINPNVTIGTWQEVAD